MYVPSLELCRFNTIASFFSFRYVGAQDFLPDFIGAPRWYSLYGIYPKYTNLLTAMQKVKIWMKHIRVCMK